MSFDRAGNDECCELLLDFAADVNSKSLVSKEVLAKGSLCLAKDCKRRCSEREDM